MPDIAQAIASGAGNPWLFLPLAVLLGALHALEPGHAKSVMAAFLIAVRGTPAQALLLGVSAAVGHTIVVWGLVLVGLRLGNDLFEKQAYPWLVLLSGVLIVVLGVRLALTFRRSGVVVSPVTASGACNHSHDHDHAHHHGHDHPAHDHPAHENASCGHTHMGEHEINARYAGRQIKPWEVMWFGFTGGLLPCPSAIAVLLVALQMKAYALGVAMVAAFSVGLAATLVAVGLVAVWGARRLSGVSAFSRWSRSLPLLSFAVVMIMGIAVIVHGVLLLRG